MGIFPWAIFLFIPLLTTSTAFGADASGLPGSVSYPPPTASPAGGASNRPSIVVPTPDTIAPPTGLGGATTIPIPTSPGTSLGRYRKNGPGGGVVVNISGILHDRYQQSMVRVTAKDLAGNVLARAMGVPVGHTGQFIAAPLSLVLGSTQQWADRIEVTHFAGNKYDADIALIDEEKNLVLLAPEAAPLPIPFVAETDERPQLDVFMISFDNGPNGALTSTVHRARIAAANQETGLLSVSAYSGENVDDSQAGTGIVNSEGRLVGMLLPAGRGVLASTLQKSIAKAQKATPIPPRMIGVILGRGVLVDPKSPGAFSTITEALEAIRKGTAPKPDPTRYTPARNRAVAPKETDKIVVKVMPGTYHEPKPLILPSDISLSGSGPKQTVLVSPEAGKPAILVQNVSNIMIAGLRIVPANLQSLKAPALIISKASAVTMLGNVFEAKGGVAAWVHDSNRISFFGNTFTRGTIRGLSCDESSIDVEANAFVGDWPIAVSLDKGCSSVLKRNLFFENKTSVTMASSAGSTVLQENSYIRSNVGIRITGPTSSFSLYDSLFFENSYGFLSSAEISGRALGRNAAWKAKFTSRSKSLLSLDVVRTEPEFENAAAYDFRVKPGKGQTSSALRDPGADLGAYQRSDFLGPYSGVLARSLSAATGLEDLAGTWGITE